MSKTFLINVAPHLANEYHPTKNLRPFSEITTGNSSKEIYWICSKAHEWTAPPVRRFKEKSGCPVCSNRVILTGYNDLATVNPRVAKEWHPTKNGDLTPTKIGAGSPKPAYWQCEKGHEWKANISSRTNLKTNCPYCSNQKVLTGYNDFATHYPQYVKEWHPTKNLNHTPENTSYKSTKKVWWQCRKGHEWFTTPEHRVRKDNKGCPECAGGAVLKRSTKSINGLPKIQYDRRTGKPVARSGAPWVVLTETYPHLETEWHPTKNGDKSLNDYRPTSTTKVWWKCGKGHEWDMDVNSRIRRGQGCPYCSGKRFKQGWNDLATINPTLASEWDTTKNKLKADSVVAAGAISYWWTCDKGHHWKAKMSSRLAGNGCRICSKQVSKMEAELHDYIVNTLEIKGVVQGDRTVLNGSELDIYIPEKKVAIEFNGIYWHSEKYKPKPYHFNKWKTCKDKGVQLIQIWEDDWVNNKHIILNMVAHKLGVSSADNKLFARKLVRKIISTSEARGFLDINHLQGFRGATAYVGLADKETNKTVALLGLTASNSGKTLEIIRYATSTTVVGGFSRLLKYGISLFPDAETIFSYSDNNIGTGELYNSTGFKLVNEGEPGYFYIVSQKRVHRANYRKQRFKTDPTLKFRDDLTERQLAELNNLIRVWDAGSSKWTKQIS